MKHNTKSSPCGDRELFEDGNPSEALIFLTYALAYVLRVGCRRAESCQATSASDCPHCGRDIALEEPVGNGTNTWCSRHHIAKPGVHLLTRELGPL